MYVHGIKVHLSQGNSFEFHFTRNGTVSNNLKRKTKKKENKVQNSCFSQHTKKYSFSSVECVSKCVSFV